MGAARLTCAIPPDLQTSPDLDGEPPRPSLAPRLNYTSTGKPVANLRIAVAERCKGRDGEYTDTPAVFYDVSVWGGPAENVAESLTSGDRVIVTGRTWVEEYRAADGDVRRKNVIDAQALGASLRYATTRIAKPTRRTTSVDEDQAEEAGLRLPRDELVDDGGDR